MNTNDVHPTTDPEVSRTFEMTFFNGPPVPVESEDCLYLNVYAPATQTKGKAVLFWIYGGSLQIGTAGQDIYDGSSIAAHQDVIVVSVNYRTNGMSLSGRAKHLTKKADSAD